MLLCFKKNLGWNSIACFRFKLLCQVPCFGSFLPIVVDLKIVKKCLLKNADEIDLLKQCFSTSKFTLNIFREQKNMYCHDNSSYCKTLYLSSVVNGRTDKHCKQHQAKVGISLETEIKIRKSFVTRTNRRYCLPLIYNTVT